VVSGGIGSGKRLVGDAVAPTAAHDRRVHGREVRACGVGAGHICDHAHVAARTPAARLTPDAIADDSIGGTGRESLLRDISLHEGAGAEFIHGVRYDIVASCGGGGKAGAFCALEWPGIWPGSRGWDTGHGRLLGRVGGRAGPQQKREGRDAGKERVVCWGGWGGGQGLNRKGREGMLVRRERQVERQVAGGPVVRRVVKSRKDA